jgi:hypothetical protein
MDDDLFDPLLALLLPLDVGAAVDVGAVEGRTAVGAPSAVNFSSSSRTSGGAPLHLHLQNA